MKINWNLMSCGGFNPKNLPWGRLDIFLNDTL